MKLLGHRYLRRLVTIPAVYAALVLLVTTLPVWLLAASAVSSRLPGKWRPFRLLWFLAAYLALEAVGIVAAAALWLGAGLGRNTAQADVQAVHYRVLGALLGMLMRTAERAFRLRVTIDAPPASTLRPDAERGVRPLLVLSRHAGPGDSFLLVHQLMNVYHRQPRVVLKDTLQWDPLIDLMLNRLPSRFITPNPRAGEDVAASIGVLAGDLTADDALVIFPEGGNFTESRRRRGIRRLKEAGLADYVERAEELTHLMAPRPNGAFAAIDAAPQADVVFVAHTGLERLTTLYDLWRGLPMDADVRARFWTVNAEEVPDGREDRMRWLYDWWEVMDTWIGQRR